MSTIPLHNAILNQLIPQASQQRHLYTAERAGVTVELSRSGSAVLISESGRDGAGVPRHIVQPSEFPYFADMRLANGDWITVEVRRTPAHLLPADFDEEPSGLVAQPDEAVSAEASFKPLRTRCNLLQFSAD